MRSPGLGETASPPSSACPRIEPLRQPDIDGIDEGGEPLRVGSGQGFAERVQRLGVKRRQPVEETERLLAERQSAPSSKASARATEPSAAAAAAAMSGSSAASPVAAASAAATSDSPSIRSVRMRQRERSVAGTRAAE